MYFFCYNLSLFSHSSHLLAFAKKRSLLSLFPQLRGLDLRSFGNPNRSRQLPYLTLFFSPINNFFISLRSLSRFDSLYRFFFLLPFLTQHIRLNRFLSIFRVSIDLLVVELLSIGSVYAYYSVGFAVILFCF